jgi:hypothetical protein
LLICSQDPGWCSWPSLTASLEAPPAPVLGPYSAVKRVASGRWFLPPLLHPPPIPITPTPYTVGVGQKRGAFNAVQPPGRGQSSRQREIPCRRAGAQSPSVLVTSAILGGAEAHSHIAPSKLPLRTLRRPLPLPQAGGLEKQRRKAIRIHSSRRDRNLRHSRRATLPPGPQAKYIGHRCREARDFP